MYLKFISKQHILLLAIFSFFAILHSPVYSIDLYDSVLLFDSSIEQNSDVNFRELSKFYGLKCKDIDLRKENLSTNSLKDENGNNIKAININAFTLEYGLLNTSELDILKNAIESYGANLLISGLDYLSGAYNYKNLKYLTDSTVTGIVGSTPVPINKDWIFSSKYPQISRELTGQTLSFGSYGLNMVYNISTSISIDPIISSKDSTYSQFPVFIMIPKGNGKIFVDGIIQNVKLNSYPLYSAYYVDNPKNVIPTMMFIRYSGGLECWHTNHNYANFTIDDPNISNIQQGNMNYADILTQIASHPFHLTIAFIPKNYSNISTDVANLFVNNPDKLSIVQHGNNHDGYEFICYTQGQLDTLNLRYNNSFIGGNYTPRSLYSQEADIVEGKTRMKEFEKVTGINIGNIMIFPYGISPSPTLSMLKSYNFNATVNAQGKPYLLLNNDYKYGYDLNFNMNLANMHFEDFAVVWRKGISSPDTTKFREQKFYLDLFVDRPLLLYSHIYEVFAYNSMGFNFIADIINNVNGGVEWKPLDYIIKRMYREKVNDDGSIDVEFFGNNIIISNESDSTNIYHIKKKETLNAPIIQIEVDNVPTYYSLIDTILQVDLTIPAYSSKELKIIYSSGDKDFSISNSDVYFDSFSSKITINVHNYGSNGGAVSVGFFDGEPETSNASLALYTIERIGPDSSQTLQVDISSFLSKTYQLYIKVDPYNVVLESNENNNTVRFIRDSFLISPKGGEWWKGGTNHNIIWNYSDSLDLTAMSIYYKAKPSDEWIIIDSLTSVSRIDTFSWLVPNISTSKALIKLCAYRANGSSVIDSNDIFFNIDSEPPVPTITLPKGGYVWKIYSTPKIVWTVSDNFGLSKVSVYYRTSPDSSWILIKDITSDLTSPDTLIWRVPNNPTTRANIKVCVYDSSGNVGIDTMEATFIIKDFVPPVVKVVYPNGGDIWEVGKQKKIIWTATDNIKVSSVSIYYQTVANGMWTRIDSLSTGLTSPDTLIFTVPNVITSQARIKVRAYDENRNKSEDCSDAVFSIRDLTSPTCKVIFPNGGENFELGSEQKIIWSATDNFALRAVSIYYQLHNESQWVKIATLNSNLTNPDTILWTLPNISTKQAKIRVCGYDAVGHMGSDVSDAPFTIGDFENPTVHLISPNGGEIWETGEVKEIIWSVTDSTGISAVSIYYKIANEAEWIKIDSLQTNFTTPDTFLWTVPNVSTTEALVKLCVFDSAGNRGEDISDNVFTIVDLIKPTASIIVPNGGDIYVAGDNSKIVWNVYDNVRISSVSIYYQIIDNGDWIRIDSLNTNLTNTDSIVWVVPNQPTTQARIKIFAYDPSGNSIEDSSDSFFTITNDTISPTVMLIQPNGGEEWPAGRQKNIMWSANDNVGISSVSVYYQITENGEWIKIDSLTTNLTNFGRLIWTIPNDTTTQAKIKVYVYDSAGNRGEDISDTVFTIRNIVVGQDGDGYAIVFPDTALVATKGVWTVKYVVTSDFMRSGGGIKIKFPKGFSQPQKNNPNSANYISAKTSRNGIYANIVSISNIDNQLSWDWERYGWFVSVIINGGDLVTGDTIFVYYGKSPNGLYGVPPTSFSDEILIASDLDGNGTYRDLTSFPIIKIKPLQPSRISIYSKSNQVIGTPFEINVVAFDMYDNIASNFEGNVTFISTDPLANIPTNYIFTKADSGHKRFTVTFNTMGVQKIIASVVGTPLNSISNPILVQESEPEYKIYWGDLHSHTNDSHDGYGTGNFEYALNGSNLDFYAQTDHCTNPDYNVNGISDKEWEELKRKIVAYNMPGRFVTILGYEFSALTPYGHHNIYFNAEDAQIQSIPIFRLLNYSNTLNLWNELDINLPTGVSAITIPHHTGIVWNNSSPVVYFNKSYRNSKYRKAIEIYSAHGTSEYYDPNQALYYKKVVGNEGSGGPHYARDAWAMGEKLGVIASSDDHRAQPGRRFYGLTGVYATQLTRSAIFEAIETRRTFATTGERIILGFSINGKMMGSELKINKGEYPQLHIEAHGTDKIEFIEVLKWDSLYTSYDILGHPVYETVNRFNILQNDFEITFTDSNFVGPSIYYVRLKQVNNIYDWIKKVSREVWAWSSPIWVSVSNAVPIVEVLSPGLGDTLEVGSQANIIYNVIDSIGISSIAFYYQSSLIGEWVKIDSLLTNLTGTDTLLWVVPNTITTQARVKVCAYNQMGYKGEDISNFIFTIRDTTKPNVSVRFPNGGEIWNAESLRKIMWVASDNASISSVSAYYQITSGGEWTKIDSVSITSNYIDKFIWIVPNVSTTQAKIKVCVYDASGNIAVDTSDAVFSIIQDTIPSFINLVSPNGGEMWSIGNVNKIIWNTTDITEVHSVSLYYKVDSLSSWIKIDSLSTSLSNPDTLLWTIPNLITNQAKVKVIAYNRVGNKYEDISDSTFTIGDFTNPTVSINSLFGKNALIAGSNEKIIWRLFDNVGVKSVSIYYQIVDGGYWNLIDSLSSNLTSPDTLIWSVPNEPTNQGKLKIFVYDSANNIGVDSTDIPFSIISDIGQDGDGYAVVSPNTMKVKNSESWVVKYVVTSNAMLSGGGIKIRMPPGFGFPQKTNSLSENFVSAKTSRKGVIAEIYNIYNEDTELGWEYEVLSGIVNIKINNGNLFFGDTIFVNYKSFKTLASSFNDKVLIASDIDGDGTYSNISVFPVVKLNPLLTYKIAIYSKSNQVIGQPFEINVVALDMYNNIATDFDGNVTFTSTDPQANLPSNYTFTRADSGYKRFTVTLNTIGYQRITVSVIGSLLNSTSNPIFVQESEPEYKIYWGELHTHTKISWDGYGNDAFEYAYKGANLDFFAQTDHVNDNNFTGLGISDNEWYKIKQDVVKYHIPGRFITILGYEFSALTPFGHHNVYFDVPDEQIWDIPIFRRKDYENTLNLWSALDSQLPVGVRAITIPHHTGSLAPVSFGNQYENEKYRRAIEIYSLYGMSEYYNPNHPLSYTNLSKQNSISSGPNYAQDAWAKGAKLGVIASSDNHICRPGTYSYGLTAVYAESLSRKSIFDAIINRRTYATTGERIILDFSINGKMMGSEVTINIDEYPDISIKAIGTDIIQFVEVLKWDFNNGVYDALGHPIYDVISKFDVLSNKFETRFFDTSFSTSSLYYVRLKQYNNVDGREVWAWSSPIWVDKSSLIPVVNVVSPDSGDILGMGQEYKIVWDAKDTLGLSSVSVYYQINPNSNWIMIDSLYNELTNIDTLLWTVPNISTTQAKIKLCVYNIVGNKAIGYSKQTFTIKDMTPPVCNILFPKGGETLDINSKQKIRWNIADNIGLKSVSVYYQLNPNSAWLLLDSLSTNLTNPDTLIWTIPNTPTNQGRIKICGYDSTGNKGEDLSDSVFVIKDISNPKITLLSMNSGTYGIGRKPKIRWNVTDNVGISAVVIFYQIAPGSEWIKIDSLTTNLTNPDTLIWTVPNTPTTQARLRLCAYDLYGNKGECLSKSTFTIKDVDKPTVTVISPNGGEIYLAGSLQKIIWSGTDNVGISSISAYYRAEPNGSWTKIDSLNFDGNTPTNVDTLNWTIPLVPSNTVKIKVYAYDLGSNSVSDTSDANFAIIPRFAETTFPLTSLRNSSVAFGDYNRDGKVDLVVSGLSSSNKPITKLYKNTGSGYVADNSRSVNLVGVSDGSVAFADIDNDGDLDLVVSGNDSVNGICNIYINSNGYGYYTLHQSLTGVKYSAVAFGDYNNDGDIDLFITGVDNTNNKVAKLYKNTNGTFTDVTGAFGKPNYFRPVSHGSVKFFNYDNDMDVDLIVTGQGNTNRTTLYTNQSGRFFENYAASFVNVAGGDVAYGDYDNDGDFDLVITGVDGSGARHTKLYKNNGDSTFSLDSNSNSLTAVSGGSVAFGDVDNDGDLDLVLGGSIGHPNYICKLYLNNGSGVFSENTGVSLPGIVDGSVAFGDYDADGDLDLVVAGKRQFKLYKNNETTANVRPNPPDGLSAYSKDGTVWFPDTRVVFSWNAPVDDNTPNTSITYNIRVGTTPGGNDVYSAAVGTDFGKYGLREGIWLVIPPGTYYWSVQAVDNGLMKSVWAPEQTVVNNSNPYASIAMKENIPATFALSQNYPNPFNPETIISYQLPVISNQSSYQSPITDYQSPITDYRLPITNYHVNLSIYSITGQLVRTLVNEEQKPGYYSVKWDGRDDRGKEVSSGLYIYTIRAGEFNAMKRMVMVK